MLMGKIRSVLDTELFPDELESGRFLLLLIRLICRRPGPAASAGEPRTVTLVPLN